MLAASSNDTSLICISWQLETRLSHHCLEELPLMLIFEEQGSISDRRQNESHFEEPQKY